MYGTKAKIGVLVPSANTVTEAEFNAMKPEGFSIHSARMFITHPTAETLARMNEDVESAAKLLATARPSIVAFACTTGSLLEGPGSDARIIERIKKITGVPATASVTAVVRAFQELGVRKVSVGTPYNEDLTQREADFFEKAGVRVVKIKGLDVGGAMAELPLEEVKNLAREVNRFDADAVFLSCTNLRALPILAPLEEELGKVVFSSNVATFWDVMRILKIKEPIRGWGKLLERIS